MSPSWQARQASPAPSAAWQWDAPEADQQTRCLSPLTARPGTKSETQRRCEANCECDQFYMSLIWVLDTVWKTKVLAINV